MLGSTVDNIANDFPLPASFVTFVTETASYLAGLDEGGSHFKTGDFLELRSATAQGTALDLLDPAGKRALSLEEAAKAHTIALTSEGFYDVRRPNGRHELVAVNADRRESDLDVLSGETLKLWENTGQGTVGGAAGAEPGSENKRSFWWYVLLAALALAVAETVVGNQHLSVDKEAA